MRKLIFAALAVLSLAACERHSCYSPAVVQAPVVEAPAPVVAAPVVQAAPIVQAAPVVQDNSNAMLTGI